MLISIDWIKDFVVLPDISPKDLAQKFTLATAEVEDVITKGMALRDIKVVEICAIKKHPEADKLNLVTFKLDENKINEKNTFEVVCGAANVRLGLKVPYAKVGTTLPNGITLEAKKIRGIESSGMLCSASELGLEESSSGLLELKEAAIIGQSMQEYLGEIENILLDVDNKSLTHRPDLWGHFGIAREFSTIFKSPLKNLYDENWANQIRKNFNETKAPLIVQVENDCALTSFWGISIDGIVVTESPSWIKNRLINVGLRPINSIVDIINYVMLELGIPSHIYDREKIKENILFIKKLNEESTIITLDKIERKLISGDTVVADPEKNLIIAGIMGGESSGVTEKTTKIFLEVANWKPAEIRKTSVRLGLRTDSSQRYEKSLDSKLTERTLLRIIELILKLNSNASLVGQPIYLGKELNAENLKLEISLEFIIKRLGKKIDDSLVLEILNSLEFKTVFEKGIFKIVVPSFRSTKDITCKEDIVEEIGRMIGFDNIEAYSPMATISPVSFDRQKKITRKIQDFLVNHVQALEVMTYPMVGEKLLKKSLWDKFSEEFVLVNPISVEQDRMRPSIVPQHLEVIAENAKHYSDFKFFEIGRAYTPDKNNFFKEENFLVITFFSKSNNNFLNLVNSSESLLNNLSLNFTFTEKNEKYPCDFLKINWPGLHPYEYQNIKLMGKNDGAIFTLHPLLQREFKIKGFVHFLILRLENIFKITTNEKLSFKNFSKYPSTQFDFTLILKPEEQASFIIDHLKKINLKELKSILIADTFNLSLEERAITYRAIISSDEETLSSEIIKSVQEKIISEVQKIGLKIK